MINSKQTPALQNYAFIYTGSSVCAAAYPEGTIGAFEGLKLQG
jgi:hypothetical protein